MKLRVSVTHYEENHKGQVKSVSKTYIIAVTKDQAAICRTSIEPYSRHAVDVKIEKEKK